MSDISDLRYLSFDDSINDLDYKNPNSLIKVSGFENMSEYERLCDIIQNNKQLNNNFNVEYDDKVRIKEASGKGDTVLRGKKS